MQLENQNVPNWNGAGWYRIEWVQTSDTGSNISLDQSYEIKSPPRAILRSQILEIFSVEY